jgi:hypothetical protein
MHGAEVAAARRSASNRQHKDVQEDNHWKDQPNIMDLAKFHLMIGGTTIGGDSHKIRDTNKIYFNFFAKLWLGTSCLHSCFQSPICYIVEILEFFFICARQDGIYWCQNWSFRCKFFVKV